MSPSSRRTLRALAKGVFLFLTLAGLILLADALDLPHMDARWVDAHIRQQGIAGIIVYIGAGALASAAGVPRQAVSFLGGYAFGAVMGTFLATLSTTLGCAGGFFYARLLGRSSITRLFGRRMEKLNAFLSRAPFTMTLIVRCLPVGNNAVTTALAGVSSIPAAAFIAGSCVGYIPQNLIFAVLGSGMRVDPFWRVALSAVLFALSTALGYSLYRRHRIALTLEGDGPDTGGEAK